MKNFIISALFIVFVCNFAIAQEEANNISMDGTNSGQNSGVTPQIEKGAEASASSVVMVGTAKMGIKNEDDDDTTTQDFSTVAEYEVALTSTGISDGGLVFGAGLTIKGNDTCEMNLVTDTCDKNSITEAHVFIGSDNGSWKLQFGDNDPGIEMVPPIGLADADEISARSFEVTPVTGKAFGVDPRDNDGDGNVLIYRSYGVNGVQNLLQDSTLPQNDEPLTLRVLGSPDSNIRHSEVSTVRGNYDRDGGIWTHTPATNREHIAFSGKLDDINFRITSGIGETQIGDTVESNSGWSIGAGYNSEGLSFALGFDSNKVLALNAGGSFEGNQFSLTIAKQSGEKFYGVVEERTTTERNGRPYTSVNHFAHEISVNEWNAMGLKISRKISQDSNISMSYSKLNDKNENTWKLDGQQNFTEIAKNESEIEFEIERDIGGGAKLYSLFSRHKKDKARYLDNNYTSSGNTKLETGLKMTF
ncbi:MAG: hypothetical protein OXC02_04155 [Rhodobacteraceae bacterium]|nr:hypothetical protein [Paracoccaceae bacterium]